MSEQIETSELAKELECCSLFCDSEETSKHLRLAASRLTELEERTQRQFGFLADASKKIREQNEKIRELEKERERLDWAEKNKVTNIAGNRMSFWFEKSVTHDSLRQAIDAAMKGTTK